MKKFAVAVAVVAMSVAAAAGADGPPRFVYVDLGQIDPDVTLPQPLNIADAINESGVASGRATILFFMGNSLIQRTHAFKAAPGETMVDIGALPEIDTFYGSRGWDINNQGIVVGEAVFADIPDPDNSAGLLAPPVIWQHGGANPVDKPEGALGGIANAVNDNNQVVGYFGFPIGQPLFRSFLWENGRMRLLDELGDFRSVAWDINNLGHIVGQAVPDPNEGPKPYMVRDGKAIIFNFTGRAFGINDLDQVVGSPQFVWENGVHRTLPDLPNNQGARPYDINNFGDIVGESFERGAMLWHEGVAYSLSDLIQPGVGGPAFLRRANGINDKGQIVGYSSPFGSFFRFAFRLDPVTPDVSGDGVVDGLDLARLIIAWGSDDPYIDLDGDGVVNTADLTDLLLHWGPVPERKPYFWTK